MSESDVFSFIGILFRLNKLVFDRFIPGFELQNIFNHASIAQDAMVSFQSPPGIEPDMTF